MVNNSVFDFQNMHGQKKERSLHLIENNIICQNPESECQEPDESKICWQKINAQVSKLITFLKNACDIFLLFVIPRSMTVLLKSSVPQCP